MKGEVVSAFRERGLHLAGRDAEPQVSEANNSMERKTDTMKTYILGEPKAVQPQKSARPSRAK
jgi:5-methylcytosine-specific restriction endonuclease McrA